jgi:hypothetical protein
MPLPTGRSPASRSASVRSQLIRETGEALDRLARKPLLNGMLKLMRGPSHLAGLGDLHAFLERGFNAFRSMGSATEFLDSIEYKEQQLLNRLFAGVASPFSIQDKHKSPDLRVQGRESDQSDSWCLRGSG